MLDTIEKAVASYCKLGSELQMLFLVPYLKKCTLTHRDPSFFASNARSFFFWVMKGKKGTGG